MLVNKVNIKPCLPLPILTVCWLLNHWMVTSYIVISRSSFSSLTAHQSITYVGTNDFFNQSVMELCFWILDLSLGPGTQKVLVLNISVLSVAICLIGIIQPPFEANGGTWSNTVVKFSRNGVLPPVSGVPPPEIAVPPPKVVVPPPGNDVPSTFGRKSLKLLPPEVRF